MTTYMGNGCSYGRMSRMDSGYIPSYSCSSAAVLQIRGSKNYLSIMFDILHSSNLVTSHLNCLAKMVLMRGHSIYFRFK